MVRQLLCFALLVCAAAGCMRKELVRVDLDTYLKNKVQYKNKHVVITASLKDVVEHHDRYIHREIEVSAPIVYHGYRSFWTWYVLMQQDGKQLRCYEEHYRLLPDPGAVDLALSARSHNGTVTARGELLSDGIELNRLKYDGYDINTDVDTYKYRYMPVAPYW
jgi:hypothetical protein